MNSASRTWTAALALPWSSPCQPSLQILNLPVSTVVGVHSLKYITFFLYAHILWVLFPWRASTNRIEWLTVEATCSVSMWLGFLLHLWVPSPRRLLPWRLMLPSGSFLAGKAEAALLLVTHLWESVDITCVILCWSKQLQACPGSRGEDVDFTSTWEECQSNWDNVFKFDEPGHVRYNILSLSPSFSLPNPLVCLSLSLVLEGLY